MLSAEENEMLTRVGPGTPMGAMLRRYWHPVLYSTELPNRDSDPIRVRLLSENLIAFRDTAGNVGLVQEKCPHRGASLFFGRNEECGIRCVYHGWKFDRGGNCVETPNVASGEFSQRIRITAYPCREAGGIIWAYLGEGDAPALPAMEWASVPDTHRLMTKRYQECNWAQALEGDLDSSHVGILHSTLDKNVPGFGSRPVGDDRMNSMGHYRTPRIEAAETDFGLWVAASRPKGTDAAYWRATAVLMPYYTVIPPNGDAPLHVNIWQPMDDETTLVWSIQYHGARPLLDSERTALTSGLYEHYGPEDGLPPSDEAAGAWRSKASRANNFMIDRQMQRTSNFTGLRGFWRQDRAIVESMGTINDRTTEHLAASDLGIVRFRRLVLRAAAAYQRDGTLPPGIDPSTQRIRAVAAVLPSGASWEEMVQDLSPARPDRWVPGP